MTCTTCGAVGTPGATWCWQCYMPYVAAGDSIPPPPNYVPTPQYATAQGYAAMPQMPSYPGSGFAPAPQYGPPPTWPADMGLVVPQLAVETGDLPQTCVVSGVPTTNMVRQRWMWAPWWTLFLGLIIRYFLADKVAGYLPIASRIHRLHTLRVAGLLLGFFAGFVLMSGGLAEGQPILALVGLVLFIGSPVLIAIRGNPVKVRRAAPGYLAIKNAHPAFVEAFRAGRPPGGAPYRSAPAKFGTGSGRFVALAVIVPAVVIFGIAAVMAVIDGPPHGCGCRQSPAAGPPPVVFTQPGGGQCLFSHLDVEPVEAEISSRDAALAAYGLAPTSTKAIQAIRKRDAALVTGVTKWGMTDADMHAKDRYLAALATYDASLGTKEAGKTARALAAEEQALREEFGTVASGCSTS